MKFVQHDIWLLAVTAIMVTGAINTSAQSTVDRDSFTARFHREMPDDPYVPVRKADIETAPSRAVEFNGFISVQVNVDSNGDNILGDAANEPSIAIDPNDPNRIAIGWRQFDTVSSNFRQAGRGYTTDGGQTWNFPGVIEPGVFRSDPILGADSSGRFFYDSLGTAGGDFCTDTFVSSDGGQSWPNSAFSYGGDKQWISVDQSGGTGDGHIYRTWNRNFACSAAAGGDFNRSTDGGSSFGLPILTPFQPRWGTTAVGPEGEVYVVGSAATSGGYVLVKSTTLKEASHPPAFDFATDVDLGGPQGLGGGPNPVGLLGQVWVAPDPATSSRVYILSSINPPGPDPLDVHFVRSQDGGVSFGDPVRINDDPGNSAWQWFGTMSVAPNGRIDVIWNDSRNDPGGFDSQLFYSFSDDGGDSWSPNVAVTPAFDPHLGWPNQEKIGDYYDMVSDVGGVNIAYSATFNGEQDVYFLRIVRALAFDSGFETRVSGH